MLVAALSDTPTDVCSYAKIGSQLWWTKSKSCGPIVEQATHFVDLSRYFGGEAVLESVQAHSLEHYEEAGRLEAIPIDEEAIKPEDRIPRVTSATWKYENGAVGSLTHALVLQGTRYSTGPLVRPTGCRLAKVGHRVGGVRRWVAAQAHRRLQRTHFGAAHPVVGQRRDDL
jgi:predicted dehydrogenase